MSKFTVGQRVCRKFSEHNQYEDDREYGEIVGLNEKRGTFLFESEWDWRNPRTTEVKADDLMTEEEAEKLYNELEAEFKKVADQVAVHIKIAAEALEKANAVAGAANYNLSELDAASPLMRAMRKCGWNTSSLSC